MIKITIETETKQHVIHLREDTHEGWRVGLDDEPVADYVYCGSVNSALSFVRMAVKMVLLEEK